MAESSLSKLVSYDLSMFLDRALIVVVYLIPDLNFVCFLYNRLAFKLSRSKAAFALACC